MSDPRDYVSRSELDRSIEQAFTAVTLQIGLTEKVMGVRIDGLKSTLRWQVVAGLVGGQAAAAVISAFITRTTPAEVGNAALAVIHTLL